MLNQRQQLEQIIVNAEQMRQIEERIFAAGMPVAALMEKAAILTAIRIQQLYPLSQFPHGGILVGPGHNGGDALVIARELFLNGYQVSIYCPLIKLKDLTSQHANYAESLGISFYEDIQPLSICDLIVDGLFGFGLERNLSGKIAEDINQVNRWLKPIVSIDIPSGLHTDTGEVLGTVIKATNSLCLGLWKLAFFQDHALEYIGKAERIDFGIPPIKIWEILAKPAPIQKINKAIAKQFLPLPRSLITHKYKQGHLLLICGSSRYAGGAILTGLGARASGIGMLSIAVPQSLKPLLVSHLPEALIIDCPETETGAIAELPALAANFSNYNVIACGPGLTREANLIVEQVLSAKCSLILDADALNILAQLGTITCLSNRISDTIITPHLGEFKRLFPNINLSENSIKVVQIAAQESGAIILLKGARTIIAHPQGNVWLIPESTPALARGGSGDVLTGLIGGLIAQIATSKKSLLETVATAAWWHAQAGILAAHERTELGVDAVTLAEYLIKVWHHNREEN